ncbi:MAG: 6-phosphogluconolactonase, partial [Spirochaetaceae bacterium]|nr:6-phosphogluconolactonase [Spirochaetaceae bacterium]
MNITVGENRAACGYEAALRGAHSIHEALLKRHEAFIILATGASQFTMLDTLVKQDLDWSRITVFHLDEYIGIPATHEASFRRYLKERFVDKIPILKQFH